MNNLIVKTDAENLNKDKVEIQRQIQKEFKLVGSLLHQKGHTLFSYNKETKEIKVAPMKKSNTCQFNETPTFKGKVIVEKDCFYIEALNLNNAIKKLRKIGFNI